MNELFRKPITVPHRPGTTQAGDGRPRRKWSVDDIERMIEAGIIESGERFELIGGDLVAMAAKGQHHELLKIALNRNWNKRAPAEIMVAQETPLQLSDNDAPEPEFIVYPASIRAPQVRGDTVLLVVEIADSSIGHDLNFKASLYAGFGVREYWVINARRRVTTVLRVPGPEGFASAQEFAGDALLTPLLVPELAVRLDDLDLE